MKNLRAAAGRGFSASVLRTTALFALSVGLAAGFWIASAPIAVAAATTPVEMLQSNLPKPATLASASKADVLSAVCKAVNKFRTDAPQIVRTATGARKDLTSDIVGEAVRCLRGDGKEGAMDCGLVRSTLHEAISVDPQNAAALTESVMALTPGCLDSPAEGPNGFVNPPGNITGPPGSVGGGGIGDACAVCHNNQQIQVACSDLDNYLRNHPGDTAGACEATPAANR